MQLRSAPCSRSPGTISPFSTAWTIGTGDFNGDGFTDIPWFNRGNGQTVIWLLNGATLIGSGSPGSIPVVNGWVLAGTGDFNDDHKYDILWYNNMTGEALIWLMNGTTVGVEGLPVRRPAPGRSSSLATSMATA